MLILAGAIQFVAGVFWLGGLFRSISPAVVHGMLAGIGALIVIGQFHILFDGRPLFSGLANLAVMPGRILGLDPLNMQAAELALLLGLVTIGTMLAWEKMRPASLKLVPGALLGVLAATLLASASMSRAWMCPPPYWAPLIRLREVLSLRSPIRHCWWPRS